MGSNQSNSYSLEYYIRRRGKYIHSDSFEIVKMFTELNIKKINELHRRSKRLIYDRIRRIMFIEESVKNLMKSIEVFKICSEDELVTDVLRELGYTTEEYRVPPANCIYYLLYSMSKLTQDQLRLLNESLENEKISKFRKMLHNHLRKNKSEAIIEEILNIFDDITNVDNFLSINHLILNNKLALLLCNPNRSSQMALYSTISILLHLRGGR